MFLTCNVKPGPPLGHGMADRLRRAFTLRARSRDPPRMPDGPSRACLGPDPAQSCEPKSASTGDIPDQHASAIVAGTARRERDDRLRRRGSSAGRPRDDHTDHDRAQHDAGRCNPVQSDTESNRTATMSVSPAVRTPVASAAGPRRRAQVDPCEGPTDQAAECYGAGMR